jgi:hypothetical protein
MNNKPSRSKIKKVRGADPLRAEAARERRKSNAAQPHLDSRTQRQRTRADARRFAIRDGAVLLGAVA